MFFEILEERLLGLKQGDLFGGSRSDGAPPAHGPPVTAAGMPGVAGGGPAGVLSPTAATLDEAYQRPYSGLDPEEEYRARRAASDAKYGAGSPFERALARFRGEPVDEPPIAPEPGAPASVRPLRDISEVIAEALASALKPASGPPPGPERPYSGLSPEEEYRTRRAASDAKYGAGSPFERAMARHGRR